jgi:flagellar biosynthesis GTPase FlhF
VLLEGPAIEPLLAQVRDEYGSSVRIISADKVRSGGIGGFFAKQHYELSVEVPDTTEEGEDMAQQTVAQNGTHSFERLLEQAEQQDRLTAESPPAGMDRRTRQDSRDAGMGDTGAAFAELMAGLDVATHLGEGSQPHRPATRPRAAEARAAEARSAEARDETPTVRPFRPAAAGGAAVNAGQRPLPAALPTAPSFPNRPAKAAAPETPPETPQVIATPLRADTEARPAR